MVANVIFCEMRSFKNIISDHHYFIKYILIYPHPPKKRISSPVKNKNFKSLQLLFLISMKKRMYYVSAQPPEQHLGMMDLSGVPILQIGTPEGHSPLFPTRFPVLKSTHRQENQATAQQALSQLFTVLVYYLSAALISEFLFLLAWEGSGLIFSSCLQLQIKTEDINDSLQQTLLHRPCHLSQGPAMMSGNQMSGVNASPCKGALTFSVGQ